MNPYVIVNGQSSLAEKMKNVNTIRSATARQQWKTVFTKNPRIISPKDKLVILNNRNASVPFRFNVSPGNYDVYLRCIAPSVNTDACIIRLDSTKPKLMSMKRRPRQYISNQVNMRLFSNISMSGGAHTISVSYREPIGLIRLTVRKRRSNLQIIIPAYDMLYPPRQAPIIQPAPVVVYDTTTLEPIVEAEYKPVEILTTTPEISYETEPPPPPLTTSTESPDLLIMETEPPEVITSTQPPLEITTDTTTTSTKPVSKKKKKGLPWWGVMLIMLMMIGVVVVLVFWWRRRSRRAVGPSQRSQNDEQRRLFQYISKRLETDNTLSPETRKEWQKLKVALQNQRQDRTPQMNMLIKKLLEECKSDEQKQKLLFGLAQTKKNDLNLTEQNRAEFQKLYQALRKPEDQRRQQQKRLVKNALDCFSTTKQQKQQKQQKEQVFYDAMSQQSPPQKPPQKPPRPWKPQQQHNFDALWATAQEQAKAKAQAQPQKKQKEQVFYDAISQQSPVQKPLQPPQKPPRPWKPQQQSQQAKANKILDRLSSENKNLAMTFATQSKLENDVFKVVGDNTMKDVVQYLQTFDPTKDQSRQKYFEIKNKLANKNINELPKVLQTMLNQQLQAGRTIYDVFGPSF